MTIRSVIIDDEPLARDLLRSLLGRHPDVEVVAEFGDGKEALDALAGVDADLLFLDVQMPDMTGIELLAGLPPEDMPEVIFVTAYDRYALKAFDLHAVDYLLKPFDEERLEQAVERARRRLAPGGGGGRGRKVLELLEDLVRRDAYRDTIPITTGTRTILQPVREVEWFESDGKYVRIHVGGKVHLVRETMLNLERILDPRSFIRVSRGAIVNVERIREVHPWFHGDFVITLRSGTQVNTTKTYRGSLKRLLERG